MAASGVLNNGTGLAGVSGGIVLTQGTNLVHGNTTQTSGVITPAPGL